MKPMCGRLRLRTSDHHAAFPPPRHGAWHVRSSFIEMTQTCSRIRLSILAAGSHAELQHAQRATRPACSSLSHLSQLVIAPVRVLAAARAAARAADTFTCSSAACGAAVDKAAAASSSYAAVSQPASQPASHLTAVGGDPPGFISKARLASNVLQSNAAVPLLYSRLNTLDWPSCVQTPSGSPTSRSNRGSQ